jgi:protein involved in polysaccharide export with SLBB domain
MRNVGNIYARGLTYGDLKQVLKGKLSNFLPLSSNTVAFTLAYSRTISVNVVGEVLKPGSYKIPAVNTAFNALMAAGGPSDLGTLREIKIIRDGKVVRTLDIYAFLANPTAANDYYMQDNDYLSVGIIGNVVSIDGAVKRPMRYEIKKGETLNDLLMYSGGFTETANTAFIQVKRLTGDESQLFEVADLKQVIQPGDGVNVLARNTELRKAVGIAGAVNLPGTYRFQEGMTLRQLIEKAGGLRNDSIVAIDRAWLVRTKPDYTMDYVEIDLFAVMADVNHPDNVQLNAKDELTITTKKDFTEEEYVSLGGSVRKPVRTKYARGIRVSTLLKMADGVKFETYTGQATLRRTKPDLSQEFLNLDLQAILDQPNGPADLVLEPRDVLTVLQKPDFDASLAVSITGAVRVPVTTPFAEGMTLGDVLRLAGGIKPNADYQRVEVSRLNAFSEFQKGTNREVRTIALLTEVPAELVRDLSATSPALDFKLQPYDQIVVREIPEYKMQEFVYIGGEVQYPGYYPIMKRDEKLSSLISRAGGPTRYADIKNATLNRAGAPNVVVNLRKAILKRRSPFNYSLLPGDALEIPRTDNLVSIVGTGHKYYENASKLEVNVPFTSTRSARRYVKEYALGFAKKADRAGLYVDYPNGNVDRTKNFGLFKDYPRVKQGATIHIAMTPEKVKDEKDKRERKPFDMNQAVATVSASLASFATLYILLTR